MPENLSRREALETCGGVGAAAILWLSGCRGACDSREVVKDRGKVKSRAMEASSTIPGRLLQRLEYKGVKINLYATEKLSDKDLDLGVFDTVTKALDFIPKFIDLPKNFELNILLCGKDEVVGSAATDVTLRDFVMTTSGPVPRDFDFGGYLRLSVGSSDDTEAFVRELVSYIARSNGVYVWNQGVEQGIAEYVGENVKGDFDLDVWMALFESKGIGVDKIIGWFLAFCPELKELTIEDLSPLALDAKFKQRLSLGAAAFASELRRVAWKRFLDDRGHPERKDFLRKLFRAYSASDKKVWNVEDLKAAGDSIDPAFSSWFDSEAVFKPAKEFRIVKAFTKNGRIYLLHMEQVAVDTGDLHMPKVFRIQPLVTDIKIVLERRSTDRVFKLTVDTSKSGGFLIDNIEKICKKEGIDSDDIEEVFLEVDGKTVRVEHILNSRVVPKDYMGPGNYDPSDHGFEDDMLPSE